MVREIIGASRARPTPHFLAWHPKSAPRTGRSSRRRRVRGFACAAGLLSGPAPVAGPAPDRAATLVALEQALLFAKISSYAQGMALLRAASVAYDWNLNLSEIARIWKGGCIIRARLLDPIRAAFAANPALPNLLLADGITGQVLGGAQACRTIVALARERGLPCPAHSASLDYFDAYRTANLPANLTQGQRDYFGAHTYRRVDREGVFHTVWNPESAGATSSSH